MLTGYLRDHFMNCVKCWHIVFGIKMQSAVSYMFSLLFGSISTLKLHQELHNCACLESR